MLSFVRTKKKKFIVFVNKLPLDLFLYYIGEHLYLKHAAYITCSRKHLSAIRVALLDFIPFNSEVFRDRPNKTSCR